MNASALVLSVLSALCLSNSADSRPLAHPVAKLQLVTSSTKNFESQLLREPVNNGRIICLYGEDGKLHHAHVVDQKGLEREASQKNPGRACYQVVDYD